MTQPSANAIIADDEEPMRDMLRKRLSEVWPELNIVAEAANGIEAIALAGKHQPDIVFLDIRMPGLSGLEVAERIGTMAHVVFVTAYDQYAVDAFDAGAVDYLLKPVQVDRLERAVARLKAKFTQPPSDGAAMGELLRHLKSALPGVRQERTKWIRASVGRQVRVIDVDEVLFFQSDTRYTRIVLRDYEALVRTPLKDLLSTLDPERFWQIHRATVVNVNAIQAAERLDAERMQVLVKGSEEKLAVSRTFVHLFRE